MASNPVGKCVQSWLGTPLHCACHRDSHLNIAQYLIREEHCDHGTIVADDSLDVEYGNNGTNTMLGVMVTSTLPSTSSVRNTVSSSCVDNNGRTHHFTMLVRMVTSTLPSTSSERNTVIHVYNGSVSLLVRMVAIHQYLIREACLHHVRTIVALHHFTMPTPTLYNICCQLDESIH